MGARLPRRLDPPSGMEADDAAFLNMDAAPEHQYQTSQISGKETRRAS